MVIKFFYNSLGARNECVQVCVNHAVCKASVTHFSKRAVNVPCKLFKVVLASLSVNAVAVPPVNVGKVTTIPTQIQPLKHALVCKPVFSTCHVNTSSAPVVTLNSAICNLCLQSFYVMFVKCLHPYFFLQISPPQSDVKLSLKNFLIFTYN